MHAFGVVLLDFGEVGRWEVFGVLPSPVPFFEVREKPVAIAVRRWPKYDLGPSGDVPSRWWGRSYGCSEELPRETHRWLTSCMCSCVCGMSVQSGSFLAMPFLGGLVGVVKA